MSKVFLDTNVLVYSLDHRYPAKRDLAKRIFEAFKNGSTTPAISTQVLQEFYNTLCTKLKFSPEDAVAELRSLEPVETVIITPERIFEAAELHAQASISFWDALIVAAAESAGCDELWSEDLQTGRVFGKLKVVNPFAGS